MAAIGGLYYLGNRRYRKHSLADGIAPSFEHELLRRKIENGVKEMWYYLRSQLNSLQDLGPRVVKETVDNILQEGADHQR